MIDHRSSSGPELSTLDHVFVYGTLRPGDVRWQFLQPFVADEGWTDTVHGRLFDTGLDYPAAIFDRCADPSSRIVGQTYELIESSRERCLEVLDREEDTVGGRYRRTVVTTGRGVTAYAYEYGSDLDLTPIESGDWFASRGIVAASLRPAAQQRPTLTP